MYKWLKENIDKVVHLLICGYGVFLMTHYGIPLWVSNLFMLAIALGKELYDKKDYGVWSWGDILADISGILLTDLVIIT